MENKGRKLAEIILLLLIGVLAGCTGEQQNDASLSFETVPVEPGDWQTFLSFEDDSIAGPSDVAFLNDGRLAVLDQVLKSVLIYNEEGELQTRFGRKGKGPGEFMSPVTVHPAGRFIYVPDAMQFVYQKFNSDGAFVATESPDVKPLLFRETLPVGDGAFLIPANGQNGHLLRYQNMKTDRSFYFGEAMTDSLVNSNIMANKKQMANGELPDAMKNAVYLAHHGNSYYAFLRGYARVQKYNRSGRLLWERELHFPFLDTIFESVVERNNEIKGPVFIHLTYIWDIQATGNGVYLLMKAPEGQDQILVWINESGTAGKKYVLKDAEVTYRSFAVSPGQDQIYFPDISSARVTYFDLEELN